jgi:dihydrofolate synthase / folylpolyglutamate synthase
LEIISQNPLLLIDGAHNHAGAKVLTKTIMDLFPSKKPIFLVSIMKDKQVDKMLNAFKKIAYQIIFTEMPNARKQIVNELRKNNTVKFRKIADRQKAFEYFYSLLNEKNIGVVTGSLLFTAYVKKTFFSAICIKNH